MHLRQLQQNHTLRWHPRSDVEGLPSTMPLLPRVSMELCTYCLGIVAEKDVVASLLVLEVSCGLDLSTVDGHWRSNLYM